MEWCSDDGDDGGDDGDEEQEGRGGRISKLRQIVKLINGLLDDLTPFGSGILKSGNLENKDDQLWDYDGLCISMDDQLWDSFFLNPGTETL